MGEIHRPASGPTRRHALQAAAGGAALAAGSWLLQPEPAYAASAYAASASAASSPDVMRLFPDDLLNFQGLFTFGAAGYGAADLGEVSATADAINAAGPTYQSFVDKFIDRARQVGSRAESELSAGHLVSARSLYLRAASYYDAALFFVLGTRTPAAEPEVYADMQNAWDRATRLFDFPCEPVRIPYENIGMPGYLLKPDDSGEPRPTVILNNGSDAANVDMYVYGGAAAVERGYQALIFESPGQGSLLWEHGIGFRPDWERVITPIVDFLSARPDVDAQKIALTGWSMCGELVIRAAAFEHRIAAVCADPAISDVSLAFPEAIRKLVVSGSKEKVNEEWKRDYVPRLSTSAKFTLMKRGEIFGPQFWADARAGRPPMDIWTFGRTVARFRCDDVASRVRCPTLIIGYQDDMIFPGLYREVYERLTAPKTEVVFTAAEGAGQHDAPLAPIHRNEVVFDWLDDVLRTLRVSHRTVRSSSPAELIRVTRPLHPWSPCREAAAGACRRQTPGPESRRASPLRRRLAPAG